MASVSTNTHVAPSLVARLRGLIDKARTSWSRRAQFNRTYGELDRLSNRELADIGLRRCDISDIARIHVYGN